MTEPVVSDADLNEFCTIAGICNSEGVRKALAAFINARVPGPSPALIPSSDYNNGACDGWDQYRDAVLKGKT